MYRYRFRNWSHFIKTFSLFPQVCLSWQTLRVHSWGATNPRTTSRGRSKVSRTFSKRKSDTNRRRFVQLVPIYTMIKIHVLYLNRSHNFRAQSLLLRHILVSYIAYLHAHSLRKEYLYFSISGEGCFGLIPCQEILKKGGIPSLN